MDIPDSNQLSIPHQHSRTPLTSSPSSVISNHSIVPRLPQFPVIAYPSQSAAIVPWMDPQHPDYIIVGASTHKIGIGFIVHSPLWYGDLFVEKFVAQDATRAVIRCLGRDRAENRIEKLLFVDKEHCLMPPDHEGRMRAVHKVEPRIWETIPDCPGSCSSIFFDHFIPYNDLDYYAPSSPIPPSFLPSFPVSHMDRIRSFVKSFRLCPCF